MAVLTKANAILVASIILTLLVWEYVGRRVNPILFTYPVAIVGAFYELIITGELFGFLLQSLQVLIYGFTAAVVIGILLGVIVGRFAAAEYAIDHAILGETGASDLAERSILRAGAAAHAHLRPSVAAGPQGLGDLVLQERPYFSPPRGFFRRVLQSHYLNYLSIA